tara:strand:- start:193 stop:342 length:150 start_codon:yes stop_codon:yes gene_type:complete
MEGKLFLAEDTSNSGQQFFHEGGSYHDDFSCSGGDFTFSSMLRYSSDQL